jgi:diketogulonate reductase-like aldo/keto reductase
MKSGSTPSGRCIDRRHARRAVLAGLGAVSIGAALSTRPAAALDGPLTKPIPATGEMIPIVGMGSWITFDVGRDAEDRAQRVQVLRTFFDAGGTLIDSSPMYLSSEEVIGHCLGQVPQARPFSATKVWTMGAAMGVRQMETSQSLWGVERFDLMQIHNMLDWETHLETLVEWKAQGRVRYIGITTSHGRRHGPLQQAMAQVPFDFVQFTYNILDREAEERLLPLAAERGMAVIVNRPFRRGEMFEIFGDKPLPAWAGEIDCTNWAQFLLKFVVSHPAVTCAIPATSRVDHMTENMGACFGPLPDGAMRRRMIEYVAAV